MFLARFTKYLARSRAEVIDFTGIVGYAGVTAIVIATTITIILDKVKASMLLPTWHTLVVCLREYPVVGL
jgi:hypothetical protein